MIRIKAYQLFIFFCITCTFYSHSMERLHRMALYLGLATEEKKVVQNPLHRKNLHDRRKSRSLTITTTKSLNKIIGESIINVDDITKQVLINTNINARDKNGDTTLMYLAKLIATTTNEMTVGKEREQVTSRINAFKRITELSEELSNEDSKHTINWHLQDYNKETIATYLESKTDAEHKNLFWLLAYVQQHTPGPDTIEKRKRVKSMDGLTSEEKVTEFFTKATDQSSVTQ